MRLLRDSVMEAPTIQRNVGKTVSVRVHPFHDEWLSGPYDFGPPGLFTMIIRAMVAPRRASRATRRVAGWGAETGGSEDSGLVVGGKLLVPMPRHTAEGRGGVVWLFVVCCGGGFFFFFPPPRRPPREKTGPQPGMAAPHLILVACF